MGLRERRRARSTGELWKPRSALSVRSILTPCSQSTIWQLASNHGLAERRRAALQESFGSPGAHSRCGASRLHWSSVNNLAFCLSAMGLLTDAEPLYRRALDAQERTLGTEHPHTLVSVNNLAACLRAMGLQKDAEPLYRRALEAQERTLGAEHPDTLASVNNLAGCLIAMGLRKDAEPLYRRALEASERTLGAEHPNTLVCCPKLGRLLKGPAVSYCSCLNMFRRSWAVNRHESAMPQLGFVSARFHRKKRHSCSRLSPGQCPESEFP